MTEAQSRGSGTNLSDPIDESSSLLDWVNFIGLVTGVFMIMSLWYRWLRPNPDFLSFSATVVELLTITSFLGLQTEGGKKLVLKLDDTIGIGKLFNNPMRTTGAVVGLNILLAVLLFAGSPIAGRIYRERGVTALESGDFSSAIYDFRQALSLDPENARTYYNLAFAYEELHAYEDAIQAYQQSLELDDAFWPSYNNLGRLYLWVNEDSNAALGILLAGERQVDDPVAKAVITKNIAWAYFLNGYSQTALQELDKSLEILTSLTAQGGNVDFYLAETHKLKAQILSETNEIEQARVNLQDSLGYSLAVLGSDSCSSAANRPPQDCLTALQWAAETRELLSTISERDDE